MRQVLGESADRLIDAIEHRFTDLSRALPRALARANDHAWQALGIALAGDGLLDRVKVFFASADAKGIREQVGRFLAAKPFTYEGTAADFRRACLADLTAARRAGVLAADPLNARDVARQAADFRPYADPQGVIDGARQAVAAVAEALAADYPRLAQLLRQPTPGGGPPLLAAAFAYFFRREVESSPELARGLRFNSLERLSAGQEASFSQLGAALEALGTRFDELLGQVLEQFGRIEAVAIQTRGAVLNLHAELQ